MSYTIYPYSTRDLHTFRPLGSSGVSTRRIRVYLSVYHGQGGPCPQKKVQETFGVPVHLPTGRTLRLSSVLSPVGQPTGSRRLETYLPIGTVQSVNVTRIQKSRHLTLTITVGKTSY